MSCHLHASTCPHKKENIYYIHNSTRLIVLSPARSPMFITANNSIVYIVWQNKQHTEAVCGAAAASEVELKYLSWGTREKQKESVDSQGSMHMLNSLWIKYHFQIHFIYPALLCCLIRNSADFRDTKQRNTLFFLLFKQRCIFPLENILGVTVLPR